MGGSDQWGNITAGIELIRRMSEQKAYGVTFPLVKSSTGEKFGKTEAGAVWLDEKMTSAYKFYQFWFNVDDKDALTYLKFFTFLTEDEVNDLAAKQEGAAHQRDVQKTLAAEVTKLVHGESGLEKALRASQAMFGGELTHMEANEIGEIFEHVPSVELPQADFQGEGYAILDLMVAAGATKSKGEARRLLQGGGVNLNNIRVNEVERRVTVSDTIGGSYVVLRKGSKKYHLVKIVS